MQRTFRRISFGILAALALAAGISFSQPAAAAVCRNGLYYDAFPVAVDFATGACQSRAGWFGELSPD